MSYHINDPGQRYDSCSCRKCIELQPIGIKFRGTQQQDYSSPDYNRADPRLSARPLLSSAALTPARLLPREGCSISRGELSLYGG